VRGWSGTDSDSSVESTNHLTMPDQEHTVSVQYTPISPLPPVFCSPLVLDHIGLGEDPSASPSQSPGCPEGNYTPGQIVELTGVPAPGLATIAWSGTDDDRHIGNSNTLTIQHFDHTVIASYGFVNYLPFVVR
jgi:hypothetical protein